jgi:PKD repeat protein
MKASITAAAVATLACLTLTGCTVHSTEAPPVAGPSDLAHSSRIEALPDSIGQDGGSQSSIRITAIGPDGRPEAGVTFRVDMAVESPQGPVAQDFGALSARTVVTGSDGVARVIYTAPPAPPNMITGTCLGLPGTCVTILATPTGTGFGNMAPQSVTIRLMPLGVILPPAATPSPCITLSPSSPNANIPVQFTGGTNINGTCTTATSDIASFDWSFGDGSTASGRVVTHSFAAAGAFVVTLTETSDRGIAASTTQQVSITSGELPVPSFSTSPGSPAVGETIFFNASASRAGNGHTLIGFSWDFGDGTSGSGMTTTHVYAAAGSYTVLLTVTDESGQRATSAATTLTIGTGAPTASFTFVVTAATSTVSFDAGASTARGGSTITTYTWLFGDGSSATTSNATTSHVFAPGNTYSVKLTVTDSLGRSGTVTQSVTVP